MRSHECKALNHIGENNFGKPRLEPVEFSMDPTGHLSKLLQGSNMLDSNLKSTYLEYNCGFLGKKIKNGKPPLKISLFPALQC